CATARPMPPVLDSDVMDLRCSSPSSFFSAQVTFPIERQVGFCKSETAPHYCGIIMDRMSQFASSMSVASSNPRNLMPVACQALKCFELRQPFQVQDQNMHHCSERCTGMEVAFDHSFNCWKPRENEHGTGSDFNVQSTSYHTEGGQIKMGSAQHESGLFSSSLSEIFSRTLGLSSNNPLYGHSVDTVASHFEEEEPFESLEEIEAQTIGNLLPDDDDLFSGVIDGLNPITQPIGGDNVEDFDLFISVGGMDLEDDGSSGGHTSSEILSGSSNGQVGGPNESVAGEHPYEEHPSRTLFVRNINSNVEDTELLLLFGQYGDIRTFYTACKHRGFVMISYYDMRAAQNALNALQNKPLRRRKLDIHFSIPKDNPSDKDIHQGTLVVFNLDSSVSNDELLQIFGVYGEIKEIRETPHRSHQKFIEFYDVRAAEAAVRALNKSDIAGKRIKLEPSCPGGTRRGSICLNQQFPLEMEQEETCPPLQKSSSRDSLTALSAISYTVSSTGQISCGMLPSTSMDSGIILSMHSPIPSPISSVAENAFHHGVFSSVPNSLPSWMGFDSVANQPSISESGHLQGQLKFDLQSNRNFNPQSLPEYHDSCGSGMPCKSPSTIAPTSMASCSFRPPDRFENRQLCRVNANGHSIELNERPFGSSGNGSYLPPGHYYLWNNSHHSQSRGLMWPNSPSFANGISGTCAPPQLHGFHRGPSPILATVLSANDHHVGSAPAVNPSLWERQHTYAGESADASGFHPRSLGNMTLSGDTFHPLEFVSHNMYPRVGRNCIELPRPSKSCGIHSHHQRCLMFPGRSQVIPVMSSFDPPHEHARGRRNDGLSNHGDNKKQYELDINRIVRGEDNRTTLMIKNIPNNVVMQPDEALLSLSIRYTSKMLLAAIDEQHRGTYDFLYLPIDFKASAFPSKESLYYLGNKCNVGYAFINMIDPSQIIAFYKAFNGKKWEKFNSEKVASLAYAHIQGKDALIAHFQNSSLMNEDKRCRPILFHTDGPNAGDQVPFPLGTIQSRSSRTRTGINGENYQGSPPNLTNGEKSACGDLSTASLKEMD
ncbi:Mei2-like, C-terminal RNA recognition motif, partial [Dillenia turbinata]